jgi:hypothetical protein
MVPELELLLRVEGESALQRLIEGICAYLSGFHPLIDTKRVRPSGCSAEPVTSSDKKGNSVLI